MAPEVLHSNYNITCAADVFSLGMTILELATDLDLPRGGEPWHQLRNGQIPSHLVSSLSKDLIDIIMKMIEPDHLKRAKVDELLNIPRIKSLINKNKRKLFLNKMTNYFKFTFNRIKNFSFSMFQLLLFPLFKMRNCLDYCGANETNSIKYTNLNDTESSNENTEKQNTSTPKKDECSKTLPVALMNVDDDDGPGEYSICIIFLSFIKKF